MWPRADKRVTTRKNIPTYNSQIKDTPSTTGGRYQRITWLRAFSWLRNNNCQAQMTVKSKMELHQSVGHHRRSAAVIGNDPAKKHKKGKRNQMSD